MSCGRARAPKPGAISANLNLAKRDQCLRRVGIALDGYQTTGTASLSTSGFGTRRSLVRGWGYVKCAIFTWPLVPAPAAPAYLARSGGTLRPCPPQFGPLLRDLLRGGPTWVRPV
jgi:hypothetical protein